MYKTAPVPGSEALRLGGLVWEKDRRSQEVRAETTQVGGHLQLFQHTFVADFPCIGESRDGGINRGNKSGEIKQINLVENRINRIK